MTTTPRDEGRFSAEERAAIKARAAELKADARAAKAADRAAADAAAQREKIASMPEPDRTTAQRVHEIVTAAVPELEPKLYYGQPGWGRNGKVVVFYRSGLQDKLRYGTLGFSTDAALDDPGGLWPTAYAIDHLDSPGEAAIAALVKRAAG
ncbi:DUF1801 domain-containing protein [Leifsonia sp. LS-T14]|uniref:DUF1801 domain-containing protein n=1 Tax=unclassified Leifsonia TaxID=2663824 RepID=UPI0035A5EBEA